MKKFTKVIKIILLSLLVLVLGGFVVLYIIKPELAKQILDTVVYYVNKPLPIVGVSVAVLSVLVWKIFSSTIYGKKKIAEMEDKYEKQKAGLQAQYEAKKIEYSAVLGCYQKENDLVYKAVEKICDASANVKIKEIGANLKTEVSAVREELRNKSKDIANASAELLIKSKEDIVDSIVKSVKKELVEKYGKEIEESFNSKSEAEEI